MTTESRIETSPASRDFALWCGVPGGPLIWLTQFLVNYMLVPFACSTGMHWLLPLSSAVFVAAALAPALIALRELRSASGGRTAFMAKLGLMISALFLLTLIAQAIPIFVLDPCPD